MRNSERILACRSLILEGIDFWKEDLRQTTEVNGSEELFDELNNNITQLQEAELDEDSLEVATLVAGYISLCLEKRSKCEQCKTMLKGSKDSLNDDHYLNILSRGGLTVPSVDLNEFVHSSFAMMDYAHKFIREHGIDDVRAVATKVLDTFAPRATFTCDDHISWGQKFATKSIVNVFFNNLQKVDSDGARKDAVVDFKKLKRQKK